VTLIQAAVERSLPLITALGAANRTDPGLLQLTDISETHSCPLARKVRRWLHKRSIRTGVTAIWSPEPVRGTPLPPDDDDARAETVLERGRPRAALPSSCALPGIVGLMAANHVVWSLVRDRGGDHGRL
jgi:tRNA A37 threonylcarbamoyladenosine dehydratase